MHRFAILAWLLAACGGAATPPPARPAPAPTPAPTPPAAPTAALPAVQHLAADTPETTVAGTAFIAPAGWSFSSTGNTALLEAPEAGSKIALIDVHGDTADVAVAAAWHVYAPGAQRKVIVANDGAPRDGWTAIRAYDYQTSPNEHRQVRAIAFHAETTWTVVIIDVAVDVLDKRGSQLGVIFDHLLPKGRARESFAGKQAAKLDAARVAALTQFVDQARSQLGVPGIGLGLIQDGKVVFAGGLGSRELGGKTKVDADTLFMIASNTKALTTLMLAKLVDAGKLTWDTPVTGLLPSFKLGDADTTSKVMVKHLICACTGLPRQDFEWLFEFGHATPETTMATLATIQPTSKFGEIFQYSNTLAAAAGFVGGHVAYPELELGAAYDRTMQQLVFDPLGMSATTFDFKRALRGNHAGAYSQDLDDKPARALMEINYASIAVRPAGGAWSSVRDLLKYVQMELASGALPDGKRYIAAEPLLARRLPQVAVGKDATYGMGLIVDSQYGVPVVHHGGDLIGFHSDMIWLPAQGVGAVILTNADAGVLIRGPLRRKLLEVMFNGEPLADQQIAAAIKAYAAQLAAERKTLTVPADPAEAGKLAARYQNPALGELIVRHVGPATVFDFGEWKTEVATRKNPDGSVSFVTIAPGVAGQELVVGGEPGTLIIRDGQHAYTFHAAR
jgi:CubicO group peptidase (beta-lactamase class C family)